MDMPTRVLAVVACCAMLGCTTMQPLAVEPSALSHELKRGDQVDVRTTGGQHMNFVVRSADDQGIHGTDANANAAANGNANANANDDVNLAYKDIQDIHRKQVSKARTALLALGGILGIGVAVGVGGGGGHGGGGMGHGGGGNGY